MEPTSQTPHGTPKQQRGRIMSMITSSEGGIRRLARSLARTKDTARRKQLDTELTQLREVLAGHRATLAAWDAENGSVR
jgi:hypothetical protein